MDSKTGFALFLFSCFASIGYSLRELEAEEILALRPTLNAQGEEKSLDELMGFPESESKTTADGNILIDSDMSLTRDQLEDMIGSNRAFSGAMLKDEKRRWPKGIIPYVMDDDFQGLEGNIYSAMKEWMENTCIVFTPRGSSKSKESGHSHYTTINGGGRLACMSALGYTKKYHVCNLPVATGCAYHAMALHELGHTIGLAHEQQRPDRDIYLKVMKDNIKPKMIWNFEVSKEVESFGIPYDYCSIMHYGPYSYAKSLRGMTYVTKNPNYQMTIGSAKHLSFYDIKVVNLMYNCNAKCPRNNRCKDPCYINHKCQCKCPGELPCQKRPCRDYQSKEVCQKLKGKCNREKYANLWCAETCGVCAYVEAARGDDIIKDNGEGIGQVVPPTPKVKTVQGKPGPKCKDTQSGCSWFASSSNCRSNVDIMKTCTKSCNLCLPCIDKYPYCEQMAERSHCVFNARFMLQDCKISCGLCV